MALNTKYLFLVLMIGVITTSYAQKSVSNTSEMCELISKMIDSDQEIRSKIPDSFNKDDGRYSKKEIDSFKVIRRKIDKTNTEKLIELTKEYGWISGERIDCPELDTWLIFRHSDSKYFDEISKLIEKEHNAKRLSSWHYKLIDNHLNGRPH